MKIRKTIGWTLVVLLAVLSLFLSWYINAYSMEVAKEYQVNSPKLGKKLLIVTQQSDYKDSLTAGIVRQLKHLPLYIEVMDLTTAATCKEPVKTNACILMHTWEMFKPISMAVDFKQCLGGEVPLFVVSTSGGGEEFLEEGVDGISSASALVDVQEEISQAVGWAKTNLAFR